MHRPSHDAGRPDVASLAYDRTVRPWRRRRPAGRPQVPISPPVPLQPSGPAVVRLGSDRAVVDPPWGIGVSAIANVWRNPMAPGGWARAWWPRSPLAAAVVAPLDLQVGHVLEVHGDDGRFAYGWIADADDRRFVLAAAPDAFVAMEAAGRALAVWQAAELARVEAEWRDRIRRAQQ